MLQIFNFLNVSMYSISSPNGLNIVIFNIVNNTFVPVVIMASISLRYDYNFDFVGVVESTDSNFKSGCCYNFHRQFSMRIFIQRRRDARIYLHINTTKSFEILRKIHIRVTRFQNMTSRKNL